LTKIILSLKSSYFHYESAGKIAVLL